MDNTTNQNSNIKETLLNLQSVFSSPELAESLLHKTLLIEFKHLQKFCPSGVYILPQFNNISIWHGVVFVRDGYYKNGIFKFKIKIPNKYPNVEPTVEFFSKMYHPLINQNGILDLKKKFPIWEPGKCFLVKVIYYIQDIFYNPIYFNKNHESKNSDLSNEEQNKITQSVNESIKNCYTNDKESSIQFSKKDKSHQLILDKLLKQNKEISTYDRIEDFKNWFMNNFMELIQNTNSKNENSKKNKTKK